MGQEAASQLASMPLLLQTQQPQILQAQAEPSNIYSNDICQVNKFINKEHIYSTENNSTFSQ